MLLKLDNVTDKQIKKVIDIDKDVNTGKTIAYTKERKYYLSEKQDKSKIKKIVYLLDNGYDTYISIDSMRKNYKVKSVLLKV